MLEDEEEEEEEEEEDNELVPSFLRAQGIPFDTKQGITVLASHVRQRETWDCGIACLQMILNDEENDVSYNDIRDAIGNSIQSVWTADLVWYLYHHHNNKWCCWFVTKSLWPNPEWEQLSYYQQAYAQDCQRVTQRVRDMQQQSNNNPVSLLQLTASFSMHLVKELVQREDCIAMVLVDHKVLFDPYPQSSEHYVGHYILLTGILSNDEDHSSKDLLVVHNPAMDEAPSYVSQEIFERAWRAQGTDEDIVFVFFNATATTREVAR